MKLSIIIVSWNTAELTLKCLKSIFEYVNFSAQGGPVSGWEVFLVDNNSNDKTIEEVEKLNYSNLEIIRNKENLGFAKANNQAIRIAQGEYILLLNSDTELLCHSERAKRSEEYLKHEKINKADFKRSFANAQDDKSGLMQMVEFMESKENIGIIGPQLLNSDKSLQRSCRRFPKLLDQLLIQLKFYNFFPEKFKSIREYFMLDFEHNEIREVDQVMGAAMLIKKSVFSALSVPASGGNKIGLLDEKFWAHFEEVDFCKRAKDAGYKIYFYPNTKIVHHKEASFKQVANLKKQINFNHSLYYYFKKHKPFWELFVLWLVQPINLLLTLLDVVFKIRKRKGKKKDL